MLIRWHHRGVDIESHLPELSTYLGHEHISDTYWYLSATPELLGQALALWRGPGLVEFRQEPFALPAARRLAELRLTALEQRVDAELELGRHEGLVGELETLVEQEPLREQLRRQLMVALYRSGRQADALERYREGRRLLVDELGIEPSPRLQELAADPAELAAGSRVLEQARDELLAAGIAARIACFTSAEPADDLARLATEQSAELLVIDDPSLVHESACDIAVAPRSDLSFEPSGPVLVPFGGGREEWAALELGAWLARAHDLPLRLLGTEAKDGRRDASRMLASASIALQRFAATAAEPVLVPPGAEGILGEKGSLIVASLPRGKLDRTRRALAEQTTIPLLLVRPGLRPGGLAPDRTLTRFSWSLAEDAGERPG